MTIEQQPASPPANLKHVDYKNKVNEIIVEVNNATVFSINELSNVDAKLKEGYKVFLSSSGRSGNFIWSNSDLNLEVSIDALQGVYIPPLSDLTGSTGAWARQLDGYVTLEMFGGVPNFDRNLLTGSDNQLALDACEKFCYSTGLQLNITGDFGVGSATIALPIKRVGTGSGTSGLFALNDSHRIYTWDGETYDGVSIMEDFTIHGYAQQNTTQGGDEDALVEIGYMDEAYFTRMTGCWSRQMGFKSRADITKATGCHMHHLLRDGLNFTDSRVRHAVGCTLEYIADDCVAFHSNITQPLTESVVIGNTLFNTYGIKCLSSRFTVANNRGEMLWGYGVEVGQGSGGFAEGSIDVVESSVSNNSFINVINTTKVGGGDLGACYQFRPAFEPNSNGVYPNDYDTTLNEFVDPLETLDIYSDTTAHSGALGISISNNNVAQTWTGGTTISDYNRGEAWTISGFQDIALTGTLGKDGNKMEAYRFLKTAENITLKMGSTYGTTYGIRFLNALRIRNFICDLGSMVRIYERAINIEKDASVALVHCENAIIRGGSIDMDPLCEHPDREIISGEPTGVWTNTSTSSCVGIYANNIRGFIWENSSIRNTKRVASVSGGGAIVPIIKGHYIYRGDGTGVADVHGDYDQFSIYTDSDPRSATYGEILQGNLAARSTLPTTDYYFAGQRINNRDYTATLGGNKFVEIVRLTSGNTNILNTDWAIVPLID